MRVGGPPEAEHEVRRWGVPMPLQHSHPGQPPGPTVKIGSDCHGQGQGSPSRHPSGYLRDGAQNWEEGTAGVSLCRAYQILLGKPGWADTQGRGLSQSVGLSLRVPGSLWWSQESVRRSSPYQWTLSSNNTGSSPSPHPHNSPPSPSLERPPGLAEEAGAHHSAPGQPQAGAHIWEVAIGKWWRMQASEPAALGSSPACTV